MNRLAGLACVAFLTFCFLCLDYASAKALELVDNTSDCILALNLARTASLNEQKVQELKEDPALVEAAIEEFKMQALVYRDAPAGNTCRLNKGTIPAAVTGLFLVTKGRGKPTPNAIAALIQEQINDGLAEINEHYLSEFDVLGDAYRGNVAAQNLAYLLFNKAERVGCAVASNCSAGNSVVICKFQPTLEFMTSEPFSKELFEALQARKKAGVNISSLMPPLPHEANRSIDQNPASNSNNPNEANNQENSQNSSNSNSSGTPSSAGSAGLGAAGIFLSLLFLAVTQ